MLAFDEEIDYLEYQNYLRSQSDDDLYDIVAHLSRANHPRRSEAAFREIERRNLFVGGSYAETDVLWRNIAIISIAIVVLTMFLGLVMSRAEAFSPQPPPSLDLTSDGGLMQFSSSAVGGSTDGMTASILGIYVGQLLENGIRDAVQMFWQFGGFLIMFAASVWKLRLCLQDPLSRDPLAVELKKLLALSVTVQVLLVIFGCWTQLPLLVKDGRAISGGAVARAAAMIDPWG